MKERKSEEIETIAKPLLGLVFDIQRYSIYDGPGIRTLVFLKGCPLKCIWCCNPESQNHDQEIMVTSSLCVGCGRCTEICPTGAAQKTDQSEAQKLCIQCGKCVEVCPSCARQMVGKYMSIDGVVEEVLKDSHFYLAQKGGVTLTGGEPLLQADFARGLLKRCKAKGIHTAIETCGHASWEEFMKVLPQLDLVLYDLKHMNDVRHKELTGVGNGLILQSAQRVANSGKEMTIRVPVIPECNDSPENIRAIVEFAHSLKTIKEIDLLPYHRLGESKCSGLGKTYKLSGVKSLDKKALSAQKNIIESSGLKVKIGG